MLPDGEAVAGDHRETHGEDHEDQETVQIENLNEVDIVHGRNGSQQQGGLVHVLDTLTEDPRMRSGGLLMNRPPEPSSSSSRWLNPRRLALPWVLWVFGLSTTLLLVGLWGRAVTIDQDTIAHSTEALSLIHI